MSAESIACRVSVLSKVGGRERNEDACGYWSGAGPGCYVLADGAGGHGGGDVASRLAVQTVLEGFSAEPQVSAAGVRRLMDDANRAVMRQQQHGDPRLADMRSTLVLLAIDTIRRHAVWGHVGDSRLYCFAHDGIVHRTRDHSLLQEMLDAGVAPAGLSGIERNVLTASLGADDTYHPSIVDAPRPVSDGSAFLLCSDGFWDLIDERDMHATLLRSSSPEEWLRAMEERIAPRLDVGADNYSAIAILCGDHDPTTRVLGAARGATTE